MHRNEAPNERTDERRESEVLLLTVRQAADRLALGRSLTYRLIQTGTLRSVKIAGTRRVLLSDLEAYVDSLPSAVEEGE